MVKELHLFKAHTPLQVLAATNTRLQYFADKECILIYEGESLAGLVDKNLWLECYEAKLSRTVTHDPASAIHANLKLLEGILKKHQPENLCLYVSELQWMCNKAFYAYVAKKFGDKMSVAFFDEGLHFYINNKLFSEEKGWKTIAKFIWMKLHKLPSTLLLTGQFYQYQKVKMLYAYHPKLMNSKNYYGAKICPLDAKFLEKYMLSLSPIKTQLGKLGELLFLSQAYYWDIPEASFKAVIEGMVSYFKSKGVKRFIVKPHHSDKPEWVDYLLTLGFELFTLDSGDTAIEVYAKQLKYEYTVSVSSSALLNLSVFGYRGTVISYGASRCGLTSKYKSIHDKILPFFEKEGVIIVD